MNSVEKLNQQLYLIINADLSTASWKMQFATYCAEYVIYAIPIILIMRWCLSEFEQRSIVLRACMVKAFVLAINRLIIMIYIHLRPFSIGIGYTFIAHAADSSFPSGHRTIFAATGLTYIFLQMRSWIGWPILTMGCIVARSRIFFAFTFRCICLA